MKIPIIQDLEWDSKTFGYPIGKITLNEDQLNFLPKLIDKARMQSFRLIYIFTDHHNSIKEKLTQHNALLVDEKTTFLRDLSDMHALHNSEEVVSLLGEEITNEVLSLSLQAGEYSRYKIDKNFKNNEFETLYKIWIEKSIKGEITFEVLGIKKDGKVIGLITLGEKNSLADISLVAVDNNYRGRGYGKLLMKNAFEKARNKNYKQIQVVTQLSNTGACKFYKKSGFTVDSIQDIYHLWLQK